MRLLVTAFVALLMFTGAGLAAADTGPEYVALGDSRAAAPTVTSALTSHDNCGRTTDAYPNAVAAGLGVTYKSVACTGVTSTELLTGKQMLLGYVPPQTDSLASDTKLVTLSIGGNDIGWSDLIASCFPLLPHADALCRHDAVVQSEIDAALEGLPAKIDAVLDEITIRSPDARTVVVGHGGYFGATGCFPEANVSEADAAFVGEFFSRFNTVLRDSADRANATFVDVAGPAVGHDACAPIELRWFEGNLGPEVRHMTPLGSKNVARLIVEAVRAS